MTCLLLRLIEPLRWSERNQGGRANMFSRLETFTAGVEILVPVCSTHNFRFEGPSARRNPSLVGLGEEVAFWEIRARRASITR